MTFNLARSLPSLPSPHLRRKHVTRTLPPSPPIPRQAKTRLLVSLFQKKKKKGTGRGKPRQKVAPRSTYASFVIVLHCEKINALLLLVVLRVERGDAWEDLALQELERRTAAGGDVGHLLGKPSLRPSHQRQRHHRQRADGKNGLASLYDITVVCVSIAARPVTTSGRSGERGCTHDNACLHN